MGNLDISDHSATSVTFSSIEGNGLIFLGANNLTVGNNNLNTLFSGVVQDGGPFGGTGGSLSKIGNSRLTLSGANTYTGGTTVTAGGLKVSNPTGSATGTGAVGVNAGTLRGGGIIGGTVTIGTGSGSGAFLAPGQGASKPTTLTIQSALTIQADGTYTYKLNLKKAKADKVVANGVTINSSALFSFLKVSRGTLTPGTVFTAIDNTAATPIAGTFSNLADGSTFTAGNNTFQVDYQGGDGNDLTLTVVP